MDVAVVNAGRVRELIDDMANMPTEIKQAKAIVADRSDIILTAKKEADALIKKAEDGPALIAQEEVVKQSQVGEQSLEPGSVQGQRNPPGANQFADNVLKEGKKC